MTTMLSTTLLYLKLTLMTEATYNFLVDTLVEEIKMNEHYDELLQLAAEQLLDDATFTLG